MSNIYDVDQDLEEKPFDLKLFKRLVLFLKPHKKRIYRLSFFLILALVTSLFDPLLIRYAIDNGIVKSELGIVFQAAAIMVLLYIGNFIAVYFRIKIVNDITQKVIYEIRTSLFEHIQKLSFRFFDGRPAGKIMSRVTNDVQAISDMVNNGLVSIIADSSYIIGIIVIMLCINYKLALMTLGVLPFLLLLLLKLRPDTEKAWRKTRETMADINANMNETMQGIKVVQAFSREQHNIDQFKAINHKNYKAYIKALKLELLFFPSTELIGALGTCIVIWFASRQFLNSQETIGTMIAFINYVWRFWTPLSAISKMYNQLLSAMASAERIFHIFDTQPEIQEIEDAQNIGIIQGEIRFENVSFGYNEERIVLKNISFEAKPGEVVALVGPTGAGKSSIINLLMRFYDPNEGRILIDGKDIRHVTLSSFRSQIGLVLQDSFIFSGTIKENICYGKLDATDQEIYAAAEAVKVNLFAEKFKNKYDTEVEERGAKLSTGQRQLLSFARALVCNPRILILDEATSSVDTETEKFIQAALDRMFTDRTCIVIAHRLSTVENADKIIIIDDGQIVEQGSHSSLLEKGGLYRELYNKQFADEQVDEAV